MTNTKTFFQRYFRHEIVWEIELQTLQAENHNNCKFTILFSSVTLVPRLKKHQSSNTKCSRLFWVASHPLGQEITCVVEVNGLCSFLQPSLFLIFSFPFVCFTRWGLIVTRRDKGHQGLSFWGGWWGGWRLRRVTWPDRDAHTVEFRHESVLVSEMRNKRKVTFHLRRIFFTHIERILILVSSWSYANQVQ